MKTSCDERALPRVLVNASNLHVGGGVGVAASVIDGLSRFTGPEDNISLLLSRAVHNNLRALGTDLGRFLHWELFDSLGIRSLGRGLHSRFAGQDVVFTVFGPAYTFFMKQRHLCGFAQPLLIYPANPVARSMPFHARLWQRAKGKVQEYFFSRSDALVVELEHVQTALSGMPLLKHLPVHVVYNTVDSVFHDPTRWLPVEIPPVAQNTVKLGIVTRNYPHKNLACLPAVKTHLRERFGMQAEFFVTFTPDEWRACSADFRACVRNAGPLVLAQAPAFYAQMDGVIFPSLLECFSATPLEAMCMSRPLFASDLPFIRDCCHEHAQYFDPLETDSIARAIVHWFALDDASRRSKLAAARAFLARYPDAAQRARSYLGIARELANSRQGLLAASAEPVSPRS